MKMYNIKALLDQKGLIGLHVFYLPECVLQMLAIKIY